MELLQHCRNYAQQYYGDILLEAEKTFANELFEQAEQCKSNEEQRRYFEALQLLKAHSEAMRAEFNNQINKQYEAFVSGCDEQNSIDEMIDTTTLSLLDRDELEDDLAISVIVSKSNSLNPETLWKLNRRLAVLRGGKNVSDETNPFGPAMVCHALQLAVTELNLDGKSKILIYKHLGKVFVSGFTDILETLNTLLIDQGILPNLLFSLTNNEETQSDKQQRVQNDVTTQTTVGESATSIAHQQELYETIKALQSLSGPRTQTASGTSFSGIATGDNNAADTFSAVDYALALTAIQRSGMLFSQSTFKQPVKTEKIEQKLIDQLLKQSDKQGRHKIAQDHADTVDLVGLIFRYMLDDANLHDAVKSLLSHLHTPYLKLALIDQSFLNNYEHSARILLNQMTEVGSRWVKEENDRRVLPTIRKTVETILKDFIDNTTLFDEVLEDFIQFKENLEKRAKMVEKRNTESQQGLERLEISKQKANEEIKRRLEQVNAPENIASLLHKPWVDFLSFNLLRHGESSLSWQSALKVVDGVIWSTKSEDTRGSKEDILRRQRDLELSVTKGLGAIGYDQQASKELLVSLREAHKLSALTSMTNDTEQLHHDTKKAQEKSPAEKNVQPRVIHPPNVKPPNVEKLLRKNELNNEKQLEKSLSDEEENILATLKDIAFGTWFEFKRETEAIQLKLAWFSGITCHYMFVDQTGVKQKVADQQELARGISTGEISIIEPMGKSFMERAFETVLETLKLNQ